MSYERKVVKELARQLREGELPDGELFAGQWLVFYDARGRGFAQPDAYIVFSRAVLAVEVKLTQTEIAEDQLQNLYRPLLERLYKLPVHLLQVCRHLRYERGLVESPREVLEWPRDHVSTWHWMK